MNYSYMLSSTDNLQLIKIKVGELLTLCYGIMAKSDNLLLELKRNVAETIKNSDARIRSLPRKRPRFQPAGRVGSKTEGYTATVDANREPPVSVKRTDLSQ